MFFSPRFQFLARNISLACAKNVNARSILVDSPPNDPDNKNNATTAPRSLEEEGNIEKHQRSLPSSLYRFQLLLAWCGFFAVFNRRDIFPPTPSFAGRRPRGGNFSTGERAASGTIIRFPWP